MRLGAASEAVRIREDAVHRRGLRIGIPAVMDKNPRLSDLPERNGR